MYVILFDEIICFRLFSLKIKWYANVRNMSKYIFDHSNISELQNGWRYSAGPPSNGYRYTAGRPEKDDIL